MTPKTVKMNKRARLKCKFQEMKKQRNRLFRLLVQAKMLIAQLEVQGTG